MGLAHGRRSFKLEADPTSKARNCPYCGGALRWMGRAFAAPKKSAVDQWKKLEALWIEGFRFHLHRGFPEAEPLPAKLSDVADFVRRNRDHPLRAKQRR